MTVPFEQLPVTTANRPYLPRIDYAADDLESVSERLIERLPQALPGWNPALADGSGDYGVVVADLFARMAAILLAYADQRANEGYLRTAALSRSLIDLAALIDYRLGAGASATALEAFLAKDGQSGQLPAGFKLNATPAVKGPPLVFETTDALDVDSSRNRMRVVGYNRSSQTLSVRASTTDPQDTGATLDAQYAGLRAGVPLVFDDGATLTALPPAAMSVINGATRVAWAAGIAGLDRDYLIADLTIRGRPDQNAHLAAAERADEITVGQNLLPVENAAMFSMGGAVLIDASGLNIGATILAINVTASPAGTVTINRGLISSIRRSTTRVLEGTSCGRYSYTVPAGATQLQREGFGLKKKDFPHTPNPGDLLLIVDASGVELVTVADASGTTITLTQPLSRALRPVSQPFDSTPTIRYFLVDPNDPDTHQTTIRPVLLGELAGVYVGSNTVLALDKSVDAFAPGGLVALGDGTTYSAHVISNSESVDSKTRLTLSGAAPTALKVATLTVYGAFSNEMHVSGYDRADGVIAAGTTQLDIDGAPMGLAAGQLLVVADGAGSEGARITQVQTLSDRVRVSLASPLDGSYVLADAIAYGNVAEVTHGASAPDEVLGGGDPASAPQRFDLRRTPLSWIPDAAAARGVAPAVQLFVDGERWTLVDTLAASEPTDHHYAIEIDDRDRATAVFGDGVNGAPPASGRNNIVARYRAGRGEIANVGAQAINKMPQPATFLDRALNPGAASGGAEREAPNQAKYNVALRARTLDRAVSLTDYADLALTFAGIAQARADLERDGQGPRGRTLIMVTCVSQGGNALSTPQKNALLAFLRARSPDPDLIRVRDHRPWPIRLALTVNVLPAFQQSVVQNALLSAFGADAGEFFAFDRRGLGDDVTLSSVYALAEATLGVDNALATYFHAESDTARLADRILVPTDALATGGDPSDALIGRFSLQLVGGLP
ncbi:MAG: hypothetical protein ACREPM_04280 [Gemmatimonadaceae bacterium]